MISKAHSFLFIHVPKTGGNSIQNVLRNFSEDEIVIAAEYQDGVERFEVRNPGLKVFKHSTLAEYHAQLGTKGVHGLFKFATMRNPWDMMISHYFSPHRGVADWDRDEFVRLLASVPTLRHYVCLPDTSWRRLLRRVLPGIPARPLTADVDLIMRFEQLEQDFQTACGKIGIPFAPLPRRNASSREDYRRYYDPDLRAMVGAKFAEEIRFGGYHFDSND